MNIEELFDNELWPGYGLLTTEDANCAINYLKTEVMEYVAGLQKKLAEEARLNGMGAEREAKLLARVAELEVTELEAALDVRDRKLSDIASACESAGCLYDEAMDEFIFKQKQRIDELEAQNLNMMALFRDFYELEFNRDECWEIIKKYGGDA